MMGLNSFCSVARIITGIETLHRLKKGNLD
jgi:hypothetical protein